MSNEIANLFSMGGSSSPADLGSAKGMGMDSPSRKLGN